jgi:hypothetical protein
MEQKPIRNANEAAKNFIESAKCDLFLNTKDGEYYLVTSIHNRLETLKIKSKSFHDHLRSHFRKKGYPNANTTFVENAIEEIESCAFDKGIKREISHRYFHDSNNQTVYVDLNNANGEIIKINPTGWEIITNNSIPFYRPNGMLELPRPQNFSKNKFLKEFKKLLNLKRTEDCYLILSALINYILADSESFIIMVIDGEQGSGKTTFSRLIRNLYDPFIPELNSPPKSIDDLCAYASTFSILIIDNISRLSSDGSDMYCRIATGGGVTNRKFHTNFESISKYFKLPIVINGITQFTNRPDFSDRSINISLVPLSINNRQSGEKLLKEFKDNYPFLLGGLYSLVAEILNHLPSIRHDNLGRMTSFSRIGLAMEGVYNDQFIDFMKILKANSKDKLETNFWNDEICIAIYNALFDDQNIFYKVTAKEIFAAISSRKHGNGSKLGIKFFQFVSRLKRLEPVLRENGILITHHQRTAHSRLLTIEFTEEMQIRIKKEISSYGEEYEELDL